MERPPQIQRKRTHNADPYYSLIVSLVRQDVSRKRIFEVLQEKGYQNTFSALKDYLHQLQKQKGNNEKSQTIRGEAPQLLVVKAARWQEKHAIDLLLNENVELRELQLLLDQFQQIMRIQREPDALAAWIERTEKTRIKELNQFGHYLRSDW